jgi:hypothetical protein
MKFKTPLYLALIILLALILIAAGPASPSKMVRTLSFDVGSDFGDRDTVTFQVPNAGCIVAKINSWSSSNSGEARASQLALILNGSDRNGYYARSDDSAPLTLSYLASASDVNRVVTWTITVANFTGSGTAQGIVTLEYPPNRLNCRAFLRVQ